MTNEDKIERAKLEKAFIEQVSLMLPTMKKFNDDDALDNLFEFAHVMFTVEMDKKQFRMLAHSKDSIKDMSCTMFIGTDINPNGIDSTGRIGRTYDVSFEVKGTVRKYRCKNWYQDCTIVKYYGYAETIQELMGKFIVFVSYKIPQEIKRRII